MRQIKILVIEKSEVLRYGIMRLLEAELGTNVIVSGTSEGHIYEISMRDQPDVIIMHIEYPVYMIADSLRQTLKALPEVKIILMSHSKIRSDFYVAIEAGVRGFVSTSIKVENLIKTITLLVDEGLFVLAPTSGNVFTESKHSKEDEKKMLFERSSLNSSDHEYCSPLSLREKEVLALVARGLSNNEAAEVLNISLGTIKVHLRHILEKLNAHNRQQAVVTALEKNILSGLFEINTSQL